MKQWFALIRWKYLAPRLIVAGLLLLVLFLFADAFIRRSIIYVGQRLTGCQVDVRELQSSLWGMRVKLYDVAVANPEDLNQNLWQFDEANIKLNAKAAFKRKLIVESGKIVGLRFGQQRDEAAQTVAGITDRWHQKLPSLFQESWVKWFKDQLTRKIADDLRTPQVAQRLMKSWPGKYDAIEAKVRQIRQQFEQIRKDIKKPRRGNPLEVARVYRDSIDRLTRMTRDFRDLDTRLKILPQELQRDWHDIGQARAHDQKKLATMFKWRKPRASEVAQQMFGPQTRYWMTQTLYWAKTAHKWLSAGKNLLRIRRGEGVDVRLVDRPRLPSMLIRHLELSGQGALADGSEVHFVGDVRGLTSQPEVYGRPTRFKAIVEHKEQNWDAQIWFDPSKGPNNLMVKLVCSDIKMPSRELGAGQWMSIRLEPGLAKVTLLLEIKDGYLDGELAFSQQFLRPVATVGAGKPSAGTRELTKLVNTALEQVDVLRAKMAIAGTTTEPMLRLESNFSSLVTKAVDTALQAQFEKFVAQAGKAANDAIYSQLLKLEKTIQTRRRAIAQTIQADQRDVDNLIRNLSGRISNGVIPANVRRRLPFRIR